MDANKSVQREHETNRKWRMNKNLLILGAGGHGQVVREVAQAMGSFSRIAFLDDGKTGPDILDVCGNFSSYMEEFPYMFPAFGAGTMRMEWISKLEEHEIMLPTLVHPTAFISPSASIFPATVIAPRAVVHTEAVLEKGCILGAGAIVDHNTLVGYGCQIDSGAVVESMCMVPALQKVNAGGVWTRDKIKGAMAHLKNGGGSYGQSHSI